MSSQGELQKLRNKYLNTSQTENNTWESIELPSNISKFKKILDTTLWNLFNGVLASLIILIPTQIEIIQNQVNKWLNDNPTSITIIIVAGFLVYNLFNIITKNLNDKKLSPVDFIIDIITR